MPFLIIIVLGLAAAHARADSMVYSYCWARAADESNVTHEFVTDVVQILNSQQDQLKASVTREIDGSRFSQLDVECKSSADDLELQQRHQKEWERQRFTFEQSRDSVVAPESVSVDLGSLRSVTARPHAGATPIARSPRTVQVDVSKCAEYIPEGDGGVASIRTHCKERIWVTYCYYHPLPDTAASRIDCANGSFGGAGPLADGGSDAVPPGSGAIAVLFACPYPATQLDLGEGAGKLVGVTPESRYRCEKVAPRTIGRAR
jgi:hypothetical protein